MEDLNVKKTIRRRIQEEEEYDHEDRWRRDFRVRSDCWVPIENWARAHDFHLVAMKGKKRLYERGYNPAYFQTFLEVREDEGRVRLRGWIRVGFRMRALSFFQLPTELPIYASGHLGIRVRRRACRDFNALLTSLKQPEIAGSDGFHFFDLDLTSLIFTALFPIPFVAVAASAIWKFELGAGLSNFLLANVGEKLVWLLGTAGTIALIHEWGVVKWYPKIWARWTSFGVGLLIYAVVTVFLMTRTQTEFIEQRLTYHCVTHYRADRCQNALDTLSAGHRASIEKRLELLRTEIVTRTK